MKRFLLSSIVVIAAMASAGSTPPSSYDYSRANSLISDAQYNMRQAQNYRSEAEGHLRVAKRYQNDAESASRRGNTSSASDYSRKAKNAMDKNVDCLKRARDADRKASEQLRSAARILE